MGLPGVTVQLTGVSSATATTDDSGQYAFTGLRMGSYSVEISGFDNDEVGFSNTAASVSVGVGESKIVSFDGTYLRTAGIMGRVSVDGEGLEGVTVSLAGGPDNADITTMTDAAGQYSFAKLRAGDYAVGISGYDTDEYEFETTSQSVTVALGETASVPFEGVLLRTSGISGRVSVEGMGLDSITVTLSMADAEDMTAMTDAGGLYAFAGLAAGDYTVGIAVEDEAYVFETMSMDVTVGDDETAIVNFEGMHNATASISGMLFIDEATKNNTYDEGEDPLPAAGVPVVLVGPGIHDQRPSATNEMGQFTFPGLKAGAYQLVVSITPEVAMALGDFAYGGPATGYAFDLGVGERLTQEIPFDITHQTIGFAVSLKSGEEKGDALPGATVTLYADQMGDNQVGTGMTGEDGVASIRFPRAGTSGNTVFAAVAAEDYHVAAGDKQAVMWDPKSPASAAANAQDIVNLNVDVSFGGETISSMYGGGDALAGWAIDVMMGDEAVEGGRRACWMTTAWQTFMATVDAGDLPVTYTIALDADQNNMLDGGEKFEGTKLEHLHNGLSLAGTMDAGTIEARFTTQTLKVYVHHERDQVHGYTGNILGGDYRSSAGIDVGIRHIDDSGRSRAFPSSANISTPGNNGANGVWTFSNVPADAKVIVQAKKAADAGNIMLLEPDELAAYTDMDANGITGGAFGAMGGFSHTVSLCPLIRVDPTAQDHGECGSFAFVSTHNVSGLVWKNQVLRSNVHANDDEFKMGPNDDGGPTFVPGVSVSLDPVAGKNLAGDAESYTTAAKNNVNTPLNETHQFAFNNIAAGVYKLSQTNGWRARLGPKGATALVGNALNPLAGDVMLDITPTTTTVYGYVRDSEEFPVEGVTVNVNGVAATSDVHGRYIAEYVPSATRKIGNTTHSNSVFVETAHEGSRPTLTIETFAANGRLNVDVELSGVGKTASISGTVTASGSGDPVAGAEIKVDGAGPAQRGHKWCEQG